MDNKIKKRGLGRGLSALMGSDAAFPSTGQTQTENTAMQPEMQSNQPDGVQMVDIYLVEPDGQQPRQNFGEESLAELTASIQQYGVLQPLIVQKRNNRYQIIAGERRWRAAKNAGIKEIPVIIKEYSSEEMLEISLIENIQREDLSPLEEAKAYKRLIEEYQLRQEEVAEKVGKSRSSIANSLRLLNLDPQVQMLVEAGAISTGHAKVLLGVTPKERQQELAKRVAEEGLSVRQLEKLVELQGKEEQKTKEKTESTVEDLIYASIGNQMQDILGTKVNIVQGKRKGKIEIEYYSSEDLERLMEMFNQIRQ